MQMTTTLRNLLERGLVVAPGCYDPFTARLAEMAGFSAIHLTGFGAEATQLGAPDLGLMTLTELAAHAARMTAAVSIPVFSDIDTGFGGVLNVQRTIREMERAGVAGVHLEDQELPKHCPLLAGRKVISRAKATDRIKAALDARTDADFVIVARTDADTISYQEMIERSQLYLEVGADLVMPVPMLIDGRSYGNLTPDEQMDLLRRIAKGVGGPLIGMGGSPPDGYTCDDMGGAGYSMIMFAASALSAAANAIAEVFRAIKDAGTDSGYFAAHPGPYQKPLALLQAARLDQYVDVERRYTTDLG